MEKKSKRIKDGRKIQDIYMKVIYHYDYFIIIREIHKNFTGVIKDKDCFKFLKNGKLHKKDGAAVIYLNYGGAWYYKGFRIGYIKDFTIKTWKKKVKELKREEKLKVFK